MLLPACALFAWSRAAPSTHALRLVSHCSQHARSSPGHALLPARTLFAWSRAAPSTQRSSPGQVLLPAGGLFSGSRAAPSTHTLRLVTCCSQHARSSPGHSLLAACTHSSPGHVLLPACPLFAWSHVAPSTCTLRLVTCCFQHARSSPVPLALPDVTTAVLYTWASSSPTGGDGREI